MGCGGAIRAAEACAGREPERGPKKLSISTRHAAGLPRQVEVQLQVHDVAKGAARDVADGALPYECEDAVNDAFGNDLKKLSVVLKTLVNFGKWTLTLQRKQQN